MNNSPNNQEGRKAFDPDAIRADSVAESVAFPLDFLPGKIPEMIGHLDRCLGFHPDFTAASILSATATAIGASLRVQHQAGWSLSPILWLVLVAPPGTGKSHPLAWAIKPMRKSEGETWKSYKRALSVQELEDPNGSPPSQPERFTVSDFTQESLICEMEKNPRGLLCYRDEINGWIKDFSRYRKGSDTEFWLSCFSESPVIVDRKSSASVRIDLPFINVAGTIQPGVLYSFSEGGNESTGFVDRFLWVYPGSVKASLWADDAPPSWVGSEYGEIIQSLLDIWEMVQFEPLNIEFSTSAFRELKTWQHRNAETINTTNDDRQRGMYSKLQMHVMRLSLVIHGLKWATKEIQDFRDAINVDTVRRAIGIGEYFRGQCNEIIKHADGETLNREPSDIVRWYSLLPEPGELFSLSQAKKIGIECCLNFSMIRRKLADAVLFEKVKHGSYTRKS